MEPRKADEISHAFIVAQRKVLLRFEQGTSYYSTFPWSIVRLLGYIVEPAGQEREHAVHQSRTFAVELCQMFDAGQLSVSNFAGDFFRGSLLASLRAWASGRDTAMPQNLFRETLAYGLSLVCMQRLEGRHHLVNMKMGGSRASTAATVSAALRRRQNPGTRQASFRDEFEEHLQKFQMLVPEKWNSLAELHRLVSGQNLDIMFSDVSREELVIAEAAQARNHSAGDIVLFQQHIKTVLREGSCYAIPACVDACSGDTCYDIVQLLSLKPSAKKYMERVVGISWSGAPDKWQDSVAVAVLGRCKLSPEGPIDLEAPCMMVTHVTHATRKPVDISTIARCLRASRIRVLSCGSGLIKLFRRSMLRRAQAPQACAKSSKDPCKPTVTSPTLRPLRKRELRRASCAPFRLTIRSLPAPAVWNHFQCRNCSGFATSQKTRFFSSWKTHTAMTKPSKAMSSVALSDAQAAELA